MDYLKEYKSFINSHYLGEGVRITAGYCVACSCSQLF